MKLVTIKMIAPRQPCNKLPVMRNATTQTNDDLSLIKDLPTNFREISINI